MAKTRVTYVVDEKMDQQIELVAAFERKTKSDVVTEAFQKYLASKDFLKKLTSQRPRAAAAAAGGRHD